MVRAELLKLRRSMVWVFVPLLSLLAVISGGVNYWMNRDVLTKGWASLIGQTTLFYGTLFYAVGIGLIASAVWRPEHRSSSWNVALTCGISPLKLVLTKAFVIMIPTSALHMCFIIYTWIFGITVGLGVGVPSFFIASFVLIIVLSIPLVLLQSLLSMLMKSFAGPAALAMGASILGFLFTLLPGRITQGLSFALPHALCTRGILLGSSAVSSSGAIEGQTVATLILAGLIDILVMLAVTVLVVRRRTIERR